MKYTAHISEDRTRIQSVAEHTCGTEKYAALYGRKIGLEAAGRIQSKFHDAGKCCGDFNDYITGENNIRRGEIDHAYAGAKYIYSLAEKCGDKKVIWAAGFIARTILSHHGLHDWLDGGGNKIFISRIEKNEHYNEILSEIYKNYDENETLQLLKRSADELCEIDKKCKILANEGKAPHDKEIKTQILFYSGLSERLMQSILIDADRTDTADFMLGKITEADADTKSVWEKMIKNLEEKYADFSKSDSEISVQRCRIADECLRFADHKTGVCRLIVPTGGGKTLSSLRFAADYCKKFNMEKIFYIAPFMSILEQNSDVIKDIASGENFLEHYSDFLQKIDSSFELAEYELRTEKWDLPVISTTFVQFLNAVFSDKTASVRRFHRLCNSVIIIDEIQAIPLKCVNLFNFAVNFLSAVCNCTIVLCSATQPALEETKYPIIFDAQKDMIPNYKENFDKFRRTTLLSVCRVGGYSYEEASDFASEKFEECGDLLFIVNTKSAAANIYENLKNRYNCSGAEVIHLSTGMCPQHRRNTIKDMKKALKNDCKLICVTTQLIEAGVDVSFKCVVRSLAGLDNAAQAAGRCNRNGEFPCCSAYIINLAEENLRNLTEIAEKQRCTNNILNKNEYGDLLDAKAMKAFFTDFYYEQKKRLSYPVVIDGVETTLVDLLSLNSNRAEQHKLNKTYGQQAFKTAGEKFNVIDSNTVGVIAPYRDGRDIILALNSDISLGEEAGMLRTAQKYTLSIYENQVELLKKRGCIYYLKCGALALKDEYYDEEGIGLNINGENSDGIFY